MKSLIFNVSIIIKCVALRYYSYIIETTTIIFVVYYKIEGSGKVKINKLYLTNFRSITEAELVLNGKSTVLFGINGTGKSTVLRSINLLYANIINQIVNRQELRQKYSLTIEDIQYGKSKTSIEAQFCINNKEVVSYWRTMVRKTGKRTHNLDHLKMIADSVQDQYMSDEYQENIPIFVNYGTNRLVLDIPLRIRAHHNFDIYSTYEKAIENRIDFRTFFEWFRENECKIEKGDLHYRDKSFDAVRKAMLVMLDACSDLRVARKPRLEMKVEKNGTLINVSQLSDGEKCTMALFGDLARRLAIANPILEDPLLGEGVVLIDEVELHMHPSWQRQILSRLRKTFPNVQFIITTHSPIVLNEVDGDYNVYFMQNEESTNHPVRFNRMDGYDADYILEEFMGTKSMNHKTAKLIEKIYRLIDEKKWDEAEESVEALECLAGISNKDVIRARLLIKRGRLM